MIWCRRRAVSDYHGPGQFVGTAAAAGGGGGGQAALHLQTQCSQEQRLRVCDGVLAAQDASLGLRVQQVELHRVTRRLSELLDVQPAARTIRGDQGHFDARGAHRITTRGDWGHFDARGAQRAQPGVIRAILMLGERITSQPEVIGAIVSGYSPYCGVARTAC